MIRELWRLGAGVLAFGIGFLLHTVFSSGAEAVRFRVYQWQSPLDFLLLILAFFLSAIAWIWPAPVANDEAPRNRRGPALLSGLSLGLALASFLGFEVIGQAPLHWQKAAPGAPGFDQPGVELAALTAARAAGRPALLYFHADWCTSCADFERFGIGNPRLQSVLQDYVLIRADVTDVGRWQATLHQRYADPPLPTLRIYNRRGLLISPVFSGAELSLRALEASLAEGARP
ncbi:MAG: thioredoxin family protein [Leptospirales bacterium]|nr:thioredoxin family protein [Leptospirales bacterium]